MNPPLRILIADDHPAYRDGLKSIFDQSDSTEVVAEVGDGSSAVRQAAVCKPEVVLMDLQMPKLNGIEATRQIVAAQTGCAVLVLTMFEDDDSVFAAMRAGARGYLLKGADRDDILRAVHAVASGDAVFGSAIADRMISFFNDAPRSAFPQLTERERELLGLIAAGRSNAAIADELVLSLKTVRNHVSNIFNKLQVADRASAIELAREAGFGSAPPV